MTQIRGGYNSSQSSHKRSTRGGGRRFICDGYRYHEAKISNDDMEDEDINESFHQDMPSRYNNWSRGHSMMSPTNGGYTGQTSQQRSMQYHEANFSNHEVEDEHIDERILSRRRVRI
ncbi:Hypothetical predicted protein [Olea europaea subsp. europaea]|uniref:Uncharacterized protein n=1 Tax=Olea europaea subsp. europaea TaxID=158383 RepID=A0A8S0TMW6_OLEEU|nr:Hypothetical predicted protein [Olea europaea subsp. europaea]